MPDVLKSLPQLLQIVNVVILLSALFFFTSTIASHVVEAWVGFRNSRGHELRTRLESALGKTAADALYGHPLIRSISSGVDTLTAAVDTLKPPSYIEPQLLVDAIKSLTENNQPLQNNPLIVKLKEAAGNAAADFEPKVLEWFKAINDHQTGVYTRWTFLRLIVVGFLFAAAMDLDTVHIAATLWKNPAQTEAAVKSLEQVNKINTSGDLDKLTADQRKTFNELIAAANRQISEIVKPNYAWQNPPTLKDIRTHWKEWLAKVLGWLLTALATSLGAQFWFNLMSEALKLRAGPPKPKTPAPAHP